VGWCCAVHVTRERGRWDAAAAAWDRCDELPRLECSWLPAGCCCRIPERQTC
jgi:hypothetical protein